MEQGLRDGSRRYFRRLSRAFASLLLWASWASATPPTIYSQPAYESPVRGDPGDLVMLPGYGFAETDTVVYEALSDTTQPLTIPTGIPTSATATSGVAQIASVLDVPYSLTITLPSAIQTDTSYALWVVNAAGEWSNGVRINDARPLWITPDTVYASASTASLPRYLKVVGRNLQPAPGAITQVRLSGPGTFTLPAPNEGSSAATIERYVAQVTLPATMPTGSYSVQVSRDGVSWKNVDGQTLTVFADPTPPAVTFDVSAYGCAPNDGVDDTHCIVAAISDAAMAGGGTVTFGAGVWDMSYSAAPSATGAVTFDGVLVPVGVNLIGAGVDTTVVQRGTAWNATTPNFALQGNNIVQGFTFRDASVYQPSSSGATMLRLGVVWYRARAYHPTDPTYVSGITITQNVFDKPWVAIADGGMPIDHLLITYNLFGAYWSPITLTGDGNNLAQPFHIDDSVVEFNTFDPGSYSNPSIGQGVIATNLGAGRRVDFSGNFADGTATQYLYDPTNDPKGWRAAHFWPTRGNLDELLVSQNVATCTGDKAGDGEAFTTDGSSFTAGVAAAQPVMNASAVTVTIPGPLLMQQLGKTLPGNYFREHWIEITDGPGRGQVRRIVSYPLDSSGQAVIPVTFTVSPAWDVVPRAGSVLVVSREAWQFYFIDNVVDQRQPVCTKGNANEPSGGAIQFYGETADSVIEGNQQYDTSGVNLGIGYSAQDTQAGTAAGFGFFSSIDIRSNIIDGEYDWASDCSRGGIQMTDGASPTPNEPPPVEGYDISIAHNTITHADGLHGGAIALTRGWFAGPSPSTWDLADNTLVFGNTIKDVSGPPPSTVTGPLPYATSAYRQCASDQTQRIGIHALDATIWHTVLAGNSCNNVAAKLTDGGTASQRVCRSPPGNSCACSTYAQGNAAAPTNQSAVPVSFGGPQSVGDLNVVVVSWGDAQSAVTGVVDSAGNTYKLAIGPTRVPAGASQAIYYAANIAASASNTVTVTFNSTVASSEVRIAEYAGIDPAYPKDGQDAGAAGVARITTGNPNDLLVVATFGSVAGAVTSPSDAASVGVAAGYTQHMDGGAGEVLEDRIVSTVGTYRVQASSAPAINQIIQLVAFRLAGGGDANTQGLTAPANLSAAASGSQVNLTWTASADNMGVSSYIVERCADASCTSSVKIAEAAGTSYTDSGPFCSSCAYFYRVRAVDAANLRSGYSNTASVTIG
jgi:hypothetical protein